MEHTLSSFTEIKKLRELEANKKEVKKVLEQMDLGIYQTALFN